MATQPHVTVGPVLTESRLCLYTAVSFLFAQGCLNGYTRLLLRGWSPPGDPSLDLSKLIDSIICTAFWVGGALGSILTIIVSSYHFGKRPVARDMTICVSPFFPDVTGNVLSY